MNWRSTKIYSNNNSNNKNNTLIIAFQKIWKAGTNRLLAPSVPLPLTSLFCASSAFSSFSQNTTKNENNNTPTKQLSSLKFASSVCQLSSKDFAQLFSVATSPQNKFSSSPNSDFTFVLSDWKCFFEAEHSTSSSSSFPFVSLNIIKRLKGDFDYNNHIYDAVRNSFDLNVDDLLGSMKNDDTTKQESLLLDGEYFTTKSNSDTESTTSSSSSTLQNQLAKMKQTQEFVDECSKINLGISSSSSDFIYFFPFKNPVKNIAYENKHFFVIVNLKPVEKAGHLLVIPKRIVGTLGECLFPSSFSSLMNETNNANIREEKQEEEISSDLGDAIKKSIDALNKRNEHRTNGNKTQCDGFSIVIQQGENAGQTVGHLHVHVIALTRGEGLCKKQEEGNSSNGVIDPDADKRSGEELEEEERLLRQPRTAEEMALEAEDLRKNYFV